MIGDLIRVTYLRWLPGRDGLGRRIDPASDWYRRRQQDNDAAARLCKTLQAERLKGTEPKLSDISEELHMSVDDIFDIEEHTKDVTLVDFIGYARTQGYTVALRKTVRGE